MALGTDALALLDARWDDLLGHTPLPNPLLSTTWLRELANGEPSGLPLVAVVESGPALVATAALQVRRPGGRFGPRVATWLGPAERLHSPDALVEEGRPDAAETLVAAILEEVDVLAVATAASGSAAQALAAVAPWRVELPFLERWLLHVPPPRLEHARQEAAYDRRRAARRGTDVQVRVAADPGDVERALVRLFRVHRARWRDRTDAEEQRFASTSAYRRWNLHAVGAMAARGHVRLAEVVEDGLTVAAALGFVYADGAVGHTTAVRVGGVLRRPGHLAALARAEALAAAGARTIDLGYGSSEPGGPKRRLGPEPDPLVILHAARSPQRQRAYAAARRLRTLASAERRR